MPKKNSHRVLDSIHHKFHIMSKLTVSCRVLSDTDRIVSFHMYPPAIVVVVWNVERAEIDARTKKKREKSVPAQMYPNKWSRLETDECNNQQKSVCASRIFVHNHPPFTQFSIAEFHCLTGIADHRGASTAVIGIHAESDHTRCLLVFLQAHRSLATRAAHNVKIRCCAWGGVACGAGGLDLD